MTHNDDFQQNTTDDSLDPRLTAGGPAPDGPPTNTSHRQLPADDPRTDGEIDSNELYDEGLTSATEADTWEEGDHDIEKPVDRL